MVLFHSLNVYDTQFVRKALQLFYGIGPNVSARLCAKFSIHPTAAISSLPATKLNALTLEMSKMKIENDLRRVVQENIVRLRDLGTYRGRRHAQGLPVRGQRTKKQVASARRLNTLERRG